MKECQIVKSEGMIELEHSVTPIIIIIQARTIKKYKNHRKTGIGRKAFTLSQSITPQSTG